MQPHLQTTPGVSAQRMQQIAAMHGACACQLDRRVAGRARADPQTIEDACSFAWLQLMTHTSVDLSAPRAGVLAWMTRTATREVWRLEAGRGELVDVAALGCELALREFAPAPDELVEQRARLALVAEVPERPRRFLLRLALGHSYREIAEQEHVSLTTTNRQIARAKRQLRAAESGRVELTEQRAA